LLMKINRKGAKDAKGLIESFRSSRLCGFICFIHA
jgi:hypothetical protein